MSAKSLFDAPMERVVRIFKLGEEPSRVDDYAQFSIDERLELFHPFRVRMIGESARLGTDWKDFIQLLAKHEVEYLLSDVEEFEKSEKYRR